MELKQMEQPNMRFKNGYCWLIACVLFLLPLYSQASAWVSTQTRTDGHYNGTYSWPTEELDAVLCTSSSCSVAICHYSSTPSEQCLNPSSASTRVIVSQGATAKVMRQKFVDQNGVSGNWSTKTVVLSSINTCFGILYWQGSGDSNFTSRLIPGSYCGAVPPTPETCEVTGDVYINHGSLSQQSVDGATKTEPLIINCTATTSVVLTLVGGQNISLGQNGNLKSTLKVSGQDLSNSVTVVAGVGNTSFPIESTLHAPALPDAGTFSGSGVVIMSYL
ncbi:MrpH family fimbial adhesin [Yersinia aleksiciae]|uniref:MrpH family fimbial adhesin n=2 Tax=Yersinia aleksiciae TaxID=263819 RepID=UPI0011A17AAA